MESADGAPIRLEPIASRVEDEMTVLHYAVSQTPGKPL
jgi:hypothetical protein